MEQFGDSYRGRRVLVTGHTGFKGSWLALWLTELGAEVAGYALEDSSNYPNVELMALENRLVSYTGDVRDSERLSHVIDTFQPEIVFHLAAQALVLKSHAEPAMTFETNVMGMVNILECLRLRPWVEAAVLITSDKVYRNEEWCWGYRETDPLGGNDPYSGSKSCTEHVVHSYFESFLRGGPTRVATARAGNVIGGGDWAVDRIVPDCVRSWAREECVQVRNPAATRPWQHVLEPLSGYLWLGAGLLDRPTGLNGETFNFGPHEGSDHTVAELLEAMVQRWPGARWQSTQSSGPPDEAMRLRLSCDKARAFLDWRSVLDLEESTELTIDWYRRWSRSERDLASLSIKQIEEYAGRSFDRGLAWAHA